MTVGIGRAVLNKTILRADAPKIVVRSRTASQHGIAPSAEAVLVVQGGRINNSATLAEVDARALIVARHATLDGRAIPYADSHRTIGVRVNTGQAAIGRVPREDAVKSPIAHGAIKDVDVVEISFI